MNASTFIKVALLEQMQQIADLGLWFHLAKLLPSGVEVLARVSFFSRINWNPGLYQIMPIPESVRLFYAETMPEYHHYPTSKDFYSQFDIFVETPFVWLLSDDDDRGLHLTVIEPSAEVVSTLPQRRQVYIHVPQWFADFKASCKSVLDKIESGELKDIEVFPQKDDEK